MNIYWDSAMIVLKKQYPQLRRKSHIDAVATATGVIVDSQEPENREEPTERIVIQDGEITLRDQLKEYQYRGDALSESNFLDFLLNTYEQSTTREVNDHSEQQDNQNHYRSARVPYKEGYGKDKKCRVVRRAGHETMPNFIGQWFPRNDEPSQAELYAASMLMLLSPWTSLTTLKEHNETFQERFRIFREGAPKRITRILDNIQYYHECSDHARQKGGEAAVSEGLINVHMPDEEEPYPELGEQDINLDITEEDIERSRLLAETPREHFFGEHAVSTAIEAGIFPEDPPSSVYRKIASAASIDDLQTFKDWTTTLKAVTRTGNLSGLPMMDHSTSSETPTLPKPVDPAVDQITDDHVDFEGMISRE
ncbi:hypothetical protein Hypma_012142 [Hypsizygus marmoreus]|uniref:Uncharacterized protein n=1 Tax=Hypsizygus marmoreus TaxID=39966 RepID=A0A369JK41_HYPMA|nr:hypothetical protein Hypma_012142 [Hypsizygus marmoreus]